jgi:hypothetical protein
MIERESLMRKLPVVFIPLLFVTAFHSLAIADSLAPVGPSASAVRVNTDYHPIVTPFNAPGYEYKGWISSERFGFSYVDGYQEIYSPEEPMVFTVEGKSDKLYVDEANGFSVTASTFNFITNQGTRADVAFDSSKRTWQVTMPAPKDNGGKYIFLLNLYCKKKNSTCAEAYGFGTQVDKTLPLKVR